MLKQVNSNKIRHFQINNLRNRTGDKCGKLGETDVCKLPFGGCKNQQKASAEPNSFTICKWAHRQPMK